MRYHDLFKGSKPVIAMLHLKGDAEKSVLERAKDEIWRYLCGEGVDALLVENYFGSAADCAVVLEYLQQHYPRAIYGVNILGDHRKAFALCGQYGAKFIQIDSVCGHLPPGGDAAFAKELQALREKCDAVVLGGVRFKYQPVLSGRTIAQDALLGAERCDAVVITGEGTGMRTPLEKVAQFRDVLGDFPLVVGAGVTADTVGEAVRCGDGVIVGSYFKQGHDAYGDVSDEYVQRFMAIKRWHEDAPGLPCEDMRRLYAFSRSESKDERLRYLAEYHEMDAARQGGSATRWSACWPGTAGMSAPITRWGISTPGKASACPLSFWHGQMLTCGTRCSNATTRCWCASTPRALPRRIRCWCTRTITWRNAPSIVMARDCNGLSGCPAALRMCRAWRWHRLAAWQGRGAASPSGIC